MKVTCFHTPYHGWKLESDSEIYVIPNLYYKSRPGDFILFLGSIHDEHMYMAAVGDDIRGMIDFCMNHYDFDLSFVGVVEYL